jgi:hypothetical protein
MINMSSSHSLGFNEQTHAKSMILYIDWYYVHVFFNLLSPKFIAPSFVGPDNFSCFMTQGMKCYEGVTCKVI